RFFDVPVEILPVLGDRAEDDDGGGRDVGEIGGRAQGGFEDGLAGIGGVGDDGERLVGTAAGSEQALGDGGEMFYGHEHDDDRGGLGHGGPIDASGHGAAFIVAGEEDHRMIGIAMGDGQACIGEATETGGNAGDDAEGNV